MNEVKIELYLNNSWVEQEAIVQDMEIYEIMHKKLKNADNNAKVTFAPNKNLYNQLRVLCNERENIKARIKRNGTVVFTGYIRKSLAIEKRTNLEPLKIELVSRSYLLKRKINQTLIYYQKTISYIIYDLLAKAGITDINSFSIPITITMLKAIENKDTYFSVIETLLFEYGYAFDFDSNDKFTIKNITPVISQTLFEFNGTNIYDKIEQKKNEEEYEKIIIKWKHILSKSNTIIFSDTSGAVNGYKCYIEIPPQKYLGEKEDGTNKEWYPDLKHEDGEVIYFQNASLDIVKDTSIVVEKFQTENDKILLSIKNSHQTLTQTIKKLDIIAQSVLLEANGENKTVIVNVSGTEKIIEYTAMHIHEKTYADALASLLANYYKFADFSYSFSSGIEKQIGDIVQVTEAGIGTNKVRIISKKYNPLIDRYTYDAEAIDEYVPAEATTSSTQAGSSSSDYINSIGTIIAQNNVNIIDIKLYQEKTTQPEVPTADITYTISTGQISGVDNGWQVSPPNSTRKPIWMINYTTAVPLVQDEVVIPSNAWSAPVKIFVGTPLYLGTTSTEPNQSTFANTRIEGDWCLCTADGKFYKWTGIEWSESGITTDNKMAALQDLLAVADASDAVAFAETLVAVDAFIQNLMAKNLQLQTGGAIYSGGYDADGYNATGKSGIYINAAGTVKCNKIEIKSTNLHDSKISINKAFELINYLASGYSAPNFATGDIIQFNGQIRMIYHTAQDIVERFWDSATSSWGSEQTYSYVLRGLYPTYVNENGTLKVYYRKYEDSKVWCATWNGSTWVNITKVVDVFNYGLSATYVDGAIRLVTCEYVGGVIKTIERVNSGSGFGDYRVIDTHSSRQKYIKAKNLMCFYKDYSTGYIKYSILDNGIWSTPTTLVSSSCSYFCPMVDISGVVRVYYNTSNKFYCTKYVNQKWTTPVELSVPISSGDLGIITIDNEYYFIRGQSTGEVKTYKLAEMCELGAGIIEEGTNSNGTWIKFSDGTMIQWGTVIETTGINTPALGGYRSLGQISSFPKAFVSSDYFIFGNAHDITAFSFKPYRATSGSASQFGYFFTAITSQSSAERFGYWIAIGRWK